MHDAIGLDWTWNIAVPLVSIILVNLVLSGNNIIAIGAAAAVVPGSKKKLAVIFGGGLATILVILLAIAVMLLIQIPLLSAIGGLGLFGVTWKFLQLDESEPEGKKGRKTKPAVSLYQAIILIMTADLLTSLDSVITVAGISNGNIILLTIGLLVGAPVILAASIIVSLIIPKHKWLMFLGAAVTIFAGTRMIFEDNFLISRIPVSSGVVLIVSACMGVSISALFIWLNRRKVKNHLLQYPQKVLANIQPQAKNVKQRIITFFSGDL